MRRCERYISGDIEPYIEFNFEKSLRKYEPSPRKKVKREV